MSLEVLLLRLISLVVPSSYHTTSALLANVILILAIGSGLISLSNHFAATRNLAKSKILIASAFFATAVFVGFCPVILYESSDKLISIRYLQGLNGQTIDNVSHYWSLVFWLVATSGGAALLFSGLVFPSLLTMSTDNDPAGTNVGLLLAANGIGGLAGTELFNSVLIGVFGIYQCFSILSAMVLIAVAITLWKTNRQFALWLTFLLGIMVYIGNETSRNLPYLSPRVTNNLKVKATHFGKDGVWLIVEKPSKSVGIMVNNQYFLSGGGANSTQRRQLLLPWIMQPEAKSVCCLALATGITASALETVEDPPNVTAVELSSNVVKLARRYFNDETEGFFERAGNEIVVEDARTFVAAANKQFDLIVGDLYRPHGTGEGRLFTQEHFGNVKRALTDEGLFCQWLPLYQLNDENWLTIAATFQSVFPETLVLYGDPNVKSPIIGLVGRKHDRKWNQQQLSDWFGRIPAETLERDPLLKNAQELVVGVVKKEQLKDQKINTLDNLQVEISAGNFWILKDLRNKRKRSLVREFISGDFAIDFNKRLRDLTAPVLPPTFFENLNQKMKSEISNKKKR